MFKKEAKERTEEKYACNKREIKSLEAIGFEKGFQEGAEFGYNKAMEEWKRCFLSCSSPYCSKQFPTIESIGVLGNMEKKENDRV